jgi:hypothetical protein
MNQRDKASQRMARWTEAAGRGRRSTVQTKWEEPREAREGSPDWPANGREFEAIRLGRGVFFEGKNFYSIVIVAPLHLSKFYRVSQKVNIFLLHSNFLRRL